MSTPHTAANSDARKRAARAEVQPDGDVEALAEVLLGSWAMQSMLTPPFDSDRDDARTDARAILASDWLAAHDAQVRREERERIAQAIEAIRTEHSEEDAVDGCSSRFCKGWLLGQTHAARIARAEADR